MAYAAKRDQESKKQNREMLELHLALRASSKS